MTKDEVKALIEKYNSGTASALEQSWLEQWYADKSMQVSLSDDEIDFERVGQELKTRIFKAPQTLAPSKKISIRRILSFSAAAAAVAIILGLWLYQPNRYANDVPPGKNLASITLANGEKIHLSSEQNGIIVGEDLTYTDGSKIGQRNGRSGDAESTMLMANTPRGGTYQFTLPDGTKVWLNAASSLRFPTSFDGQKKRYVELTGEAYFEVAHNKKQPFVLKTGIQELAVLGTHFNVNSYDEVVKSTLLEGTILVRYADPTKSKVEDYKILTPGEQSVLNIAGISVNKVHTAQYVAWKEGYFKFEDETIEKIMEDIARWYDVEVLFENKSQYRFTGTISRSVNINQLLNMLERTKKVKFKVEGRRISVMN